MAGEIQKCRCTEMLGDHSCWSETRFVGRKVDIVVKRRRGEGRVLK
jgi:hypothetical protein